MSQLGERVKRVRRDNKLSQQAFAKALNVHRGHISKIEIGAAKPSETLLLMICLEFNISWNWLNEGKGPMKARWGPYEFKKLAESNPKQKILLILLEVTLGLVDVSHHAFQCLGDDAFLLTDPAIKPGDPAVIEIVRSILAKLEVAALNAGKLKPPVKSWTDLTQEEKSTIDVLRNIDNASLKDFYLFLASKADRLDKEQRKKLRTHIGVLKRASR